MLPIGVMIGNGAFSLAKGFEDRNKEREEQARAAEQKAYERKRQAEQDRMTLEKHVWEKKQAEQGLKAGEIKLDDDTDIYKQKHNARYWTQNYITANSRLSSGDRDGALDTLSSATNGDENLSYNIDYQRDGNGKIVYGEQVVADGKTKVSTVNMVVKDRKTGLSRVMTASPEDLISAMSQKTNPEGYAKSELDWQDYSRKKKLDYGYDVSLEDYKDKIGDGNAQRDYNFKILEDDNATSNNIKEDGARTQNQVYQWNNTSGIVEKVNAETRRMEEERKAQEAERTQYGGRTKKEYDAWVKTTKNLPTKLSTNISKSINPTSNAVAKDLGVDVGKARMGVGNFNKYLSAAINAKDATSYSNNLRNAMSSLYQMIPPNVFKTEAEKQQYVEVIASQITGYGTLTDLGSAIGEYRKIVGLGGAKTQNVKPVKPTLTPPNTKVTTVPNPINNNTPYNGVQPNYAPVPGADQKLVNDVLK